MLNLLIDVDHIDNTAYFAAGRAAVETGDIERVRCMMEHAEMHMEKRDMSFYGEAIGYALEKRLMGSPNSSKSFKISASISSIFMATFSDLQFFPRSPCVKRIKQIKPFLWIVQLRVPNLPELFNAL